jgi:hypothetical protein
MFLSLAAVDIARNAHYKTDVAKPHAPKNQISNGKRRHQEQRNLHDAERFSAWWLSTLPELLITKPTLRNHLQLINPFYLGGIKFIDTIISK